MSNKVIGVVLTYNRKGLLERCLEAVRKQTRPCDLVIVINNASTDGTLEFLKREIDDTLVVYSMKKNVGAAGGFNAGFKLAYDNGADHVWMMDDDVIPEADALEKLLEADSLLASKGLSQSYLISTAFTEQGQVTNTPQVSCARNKIGYISWPEQLEHGLVAVESATFVSILVPRQTLDEYGLPIASMFIWGEDAEYTLRVTRKNPGFLVGSSRVAHLRHGGGGSINILAETNTARVKYYKNYIRNNIFIARRYKSRRRIISILFRNFKLVCHLISKKQVGKAWVVISGLIESVRFRPTIEFINTDYDYSNIRLTSSKANTDFEVKAQELGFFEAEGLGLARHC